MLIVCTQDPNIINWTKNVASQSGLWSPIEVLPTGASQDQANAALSAAVGRLHPADALCLSAHGNDEEIGDESGGWSFSYDTVARLLLESAPKGYQGPILIHACAKQVANFAARLAVALEKLRALSGVWIYGYQKAVDVQSRYPNPQTLDKNRELYATRVGPKAGAASFAPSPQRAGGSYQILLPHGALLQVQAGFDASEVQSLIAALLPRNTLGATPLTNLSVWSGATQVLAAPTGEYDPAGPTLWVRQENSQELNGGPHEGVVYTITFAEAGSPKVMTYKNRTAGVGYEFE